MNYKRWVASAKTLIEQIRKLPGEAQVGVDIAPPLSASALKLIRSKWKRHLPAELIRFWTQGSAHFYASYLWTPPLLERDALREVFECDNSIYGGPEFLSASEVDPEPVDTSDFAGDILSGSDEQCRRTLDLWGRAIIILHIGNGDCLGLDPEAFGCDPDDPPVVHLVHDSSTSIQICSSFTRFLSVWEELCYVGPDIGQLFYWLDKETQELSVDAHQTRKLRDLLTPRDRSASSS